MWISSDPWTNITCIPCQSIGPCHYARTLESVRPVFCFFVRIIAISLQTYRDLATSVWAAITRYALRLPKHKLWAVDHSARVSRKSKANFVINCELQNALIILLSNAHCGYWLPVAPFGWGSVVSSIVTFVSGGLWGVMVLMSCRELSWRLIKVSLFERLGEHVLNSVWAGWVERVRQKIQLFFLAPCIFHRWWVCKFGQRDE